MSTYVIGDVQGCYQPLQDLLTHIGFSPNTDTLWFCGDIINRGPDSLACLRFIKNLSEKAITVLGNHDLALLVIANGFLRPKTQDTLEAILKAKDKLDLINWLTNRPLLHHSPEHKVTLVHAGIYPLWTLSEAKDYAHEAEVALQNKSTQKELFKNLFGNHPNCWSSGLPYLDRLRFIINSFTRMRVLTLDGKMNFTFKGPVSKTPKGYFPWYKLSPLATQETKIIFGHWAALNGLCDSTSAMAIDTGCVWGNQLTAVCLETNQKFSVACPKVN
jgi:bis(5'-nucleosyl)-tetraphosphatase (symmetrical)